MDISEVLLEGVRRGASDILISAGAPITYHVAGLLEQHEPADASHPRGEREPGLPAAEAGSGARSSSRRRSWTSRSTSRTSRASGSASTGSGAPWPRSCA